MVTANGLIDAAEATRNPWLLAYALLACGYAFRDTDPDRALDGVAPRGGHRAGQRQPVQRDTTGVLAVRP